MVRLTDRPDMTLDVYRGRKTTIQPTNLDKREYLMIIFLLCFYFSSKPYVVTPHLNRLAETVQMRGHNICFYAKLTKIIPNYHQIPPLD